MIWHKDARKKAGGRWECRVVTNERTRRWHRERYSTDSVWAEKRRKRLRDRYANDPAWAERQRAQTRRWREDHPGERWERYKRERLQELRRQRAQVVLQLNELGGNVD